MSNCGKIRSFKVWQIVISNCDTAEIKLNSSATSFFPFVLSKLVVNSKHIFCFCFPSFTGFFSFFFCPVFSSLYFSLSLSLCLSLSASISNLVFVFASFRLSPLDFGILSFVFYGYHVYLIFLLFYCIFFIIIIVMIITFFLSFMISKTNKATKKYQYFA